MRRENPAQTEMVFEERKAPVASIRDVQRLVQTLHIRGRLTAKEICIEWSWLPTENKKRRVRAIARAARPGIISHPNSDGYQLLRNCSLEEFNHCIAAIDSVIRDNMITKKLYLDAYYSRERQ